MHMRPTELLSADELESIHTGSLRVLSEIGMDFLDVDARDVLRAAGASVTPDSQRVRFDPEMVNELIKTAPSEFTLHARNPERDVQLGGDWVAFGTVGSPPNVAVSLTCERPMKARPPAKNRPRVKPGSSATVSTLRTSPVSRAGPAPAAPRVTRSASRARSSRRPASMRGRTQ
jgi:hypothetical protein